MSTSFADHWSLNFLNFNSIRKVSLFLFTITFAPIFVEIPALLEAEDFIDMTGVQIGSCCGGLNFVAFIDTDDWMDYGVVLNADAIWQIDFSVSSDNINEEITVINE